MQWRGISLRFPIQSSALEYTLKVIADCGFAIEINTSGKTKDCGGWYPTDDILERALHYGVNLTLGSDTHDPSRGGDEFEMVKQRIIDIGFKEWAYLKAKKKFLVPLEE